VSARAKLALFPLENVVLLPELALPLHVFEPRYRQLTADALASDRRIGMIAVRPEHAHDLSGDPPLYEVGCAGVVTEHRRLPDGRYHLLLQGTHRFRVIAELPRAAERLYRIAETEALAETPGDERRATELRERVIDLLIGLSERTRGQSQSIDEARLRALDLARFANGVSQAVNLPTREKQSLLEAESTEERLARLAGALDFQLAWRASPAAGGSETLH
jgi:Lon protease-like protein